MMTVSQKLGEKMYAGMQGDAGAAAAQAAAGGAGMGGTAGGAQQSTGAKSDDVVDADYKEVTRG
jgi:molecular chaperone DnaK